MSLSVRKVIQQQMYGRKIFILKTNTSKSEPLIWNTNSVVTRNNYAFTGNDFYFKLLRFKIILNVKNFKRIKR